MDHTRNIPNLQMQSFVRSHYNRDVMELNKAVSCVTWIYFRHPVIGVDENLLARPDLARLFPWRIFNL